MDDNGDRGMRDGQRQDETPAWTHPAFADAVRAADLTRTQYMQLAARRKAQQSQQQNQQPSPRQGYQQVHQQGHPQSHPQSQPARPQVQQAHPQSHQQVPQQGHVHGHPQAQQRSHQQVQQVQQGHLQNRQQVPHQGHAQSSPQIQQQSHQQSQSQEEEWRQQQHQYYRLQQLQAFQAQQQHHRQSPTPVPNSAQHSNGTLNRAQSAQPGHSQPATVAQPPRTSTESPIADSREQYVRPSDLGPSMSHYGVNPLRRTSVPFTTQSQQPPPQQAAAGEDNTQMPARSQSHAHPSSNPSSTPGQADQRRNVATSNSAPPSAPSSIAPPRPDSTAGRKQQVSQAKATPVQSPRPVDKKDLAGNNGKSPAANAMNTMDPPKGDPYTSASRTTIDRHTANQTQTSANKSPSAPKPSSQEPARRPTIPTPHPLTNANTSGVSTPPLPAARTSGSSTTPSQRASSTQSASTERNRPSPSSSTLPATKSVPSPQPRPSSTPAVSVESSRHSSEPNQSKQSKPDLKTSDIPARSSPGQPRLDQGSREQGQPSGPQVPPQRSASVPQKTHGTMQPPSRPDRMPAVIGTQSPVPSSNRNPPANIQATQHRDTPRSSQSTGAASQVASTQPASSTTAPTKEIPREVQNALPSNKRKWTLYDFPNGLPVPSRTPTQGDMPPPNKMPRVENGANQGQSLKTVDNDNPLKKIRQSMSYQYKPRSGLKSRSDLVQPFDSNDTDPKEAYDPATIARDVLIVATKHPFEPRLNDHLSIIMKNFPHVDISTDLATLRWDLIDPVAPPEEPSHRPVPAQQPQMPAPQRPAPQMRPPVQAPQHAPPMNAPLYASGLPNYPRAVGYHSPYIHPSSFAGFPPPPYYTPIVQNHYPFPPPGQAPYSFPTPYLSAPPSAPSSTQAPTPYSAPAPRPTKPTPQKPASTPKANPPKQSKPSKPSKKPEGSGLVKATPPPQPQVIVDLSPGPKKPLESPRAQKHPALEVVIQSPRKMPPLKGRGGRPKKIAKIAEPLPEFPVFVCRWTKCQAELHNLVGLKNHVVKKHVPHNMVCGWNDCKHTNPMTAADLWQHVQDSHIKPISWSLGDGPAATLFADDGPSALEMSSLSGYNLNVRQGAVSLPAQPAVVSAYGRLHGMTGSNGKALVRKMGGCNWKESAAPAADLSACRLSSKARDHTSRVPELAMTPDSD